MPLELAARLGCRVVGVEPVEHNVRDGIHHIVVTDGSVASTPDFRP